MTQPDPTYAPRTATNRTFTSLVPVPAVVNAAFWILIGGGALTVVVLILSVIAAGATTSDPTGQALTITLFGGVIGLLIRIGVAVILRRGYGPARIYLTVVAALSIMILALHPLDPIGVLQLVLLVVPVILVWLPAAHRYFRTVGEARRQAKAAGMRVGFLG